jgi:hypothetical protein
MYKPTAILKSVLLVWQNDVGELVKLGLPLGFSDGLELGLRLGCTEMLGLPLGFSDRLELGPSLGRTEILGLLLRFSDGLELGLRLGCTEILGLPLGFSDGLELGLRLGVRVVGSQLVFLLWALQLMVYVFWACALWASQLMVYVFWAYALWAFCQLNLKKQETGVQSQRCPCFSQRMIWDTETMHTQRLHSTHQQLLKEAAPKN